MGMDDLLVSLRKEVGASASALISRDGLVEASDLPEDVSQETFSIMCAAIMGAGSTAATELGRGAPREIVLRSEDVHILLLAAGRKSVLAVVVPPDADLAAVEQGARRILQQLVEA